RTRLRSFADITWMQYLERNELELKNMLTVGRIIVEAALSRKGSVGAHYRSDYKDRGENWQEHIAWDNNKLNFGKGVPR
ncbi:MAG: hypothetical protein HZA17_11655, partial [Nitrospirae bacterium]|nr:hypothetical protein [Nitrospirota bacterium]